MMFVDLSPERLTLYEFAAGKNYHNFEMEYAMNLQQLFFVQRFSILRLV